MSKPMSLIEQLGTAEIIAFYKRKGCNQFDQICQAVHKRKYRLVLLCSEFKKLCVYQCGLSLCECSSVVKELEQVFELNFYTSSW